MGHYSNDADSVRVDFFKDTGKWYTTEAVKMTGPFEGGSLVDIFERALYTHLLTVTSDPCKPGVRLRGMWAVCLAPYHEHEHPLMRRVPFGACKRCASLLFSEGATICARCADEDGP